MQNIGTTEVYGFTWPGKCAAAASAASPSSCVLMPDKLQGSNTKKTHNIFVEGDNLDALKLLMPTHRGKVDVIFIDPPYNTGSASFVYPDNYRLTAKECRSMPESESGAKRHAGWCSMMFPLFILSRNILAEDGVIFITLDDGEHAQARMMLDEVFGEENFITEFVWEKKRKPSFLHRNVGKIFDYIICYANNADATAQFSVEKTAHGKRYPLNNTGNGVSTLTFPPNSVRFGFKNGCFSPADMSGGNVITFLEKDVTIKNHTNETELVLKGEWRYSQAKLNDALANGDEIYISKAPFRPNHIKTGGQAKKMKNMLTASHYGAETNEDATAQITELFGSPIFETPKPVGLVKLLVSAATHNKPNAVILDYFAGSATTAEAVMRLNAEEQQKGGKGKRSFIMVQTPEKTAKGSEAEKQGFKNIAEISRRRITLAGTKIQRDYPALKASLDISFNSFKIEQNK